MNISLPPELKRFVDKKVKEGLYSSGAELILDVLRRYRERDYLLSLHGTNSIRPIPDPSETDYSNLGGIGMDGNIEAMAFIVLMEAAKDAQEDLKAIMSEVKAINSTKKKLRELITKVNKDIAANAGQRDKKPPLDVSAGMGSQPAYHRAYMPYADPESDGGVKYVRTDLYPGKIDDIAQLEAIRDHLKGELDNMNEMSEMTSLRLQMMMDRRSKYISTLSNIMKKISTTQDTLVQNLK